MKKALSVFGSFVMIWVVLFGFSEDSYAATRTVNLYNGQEFATTAPTYKGPGTMKFHVYVDNQRDYQVVARLFVGSHNVATMVSQDSWDTISEDVKTSYTGKVVLQLECRDINTGCYATGSLSW